MLICNLIIAVAIFWTPVSSDFIYNGFRTARLVLDGLAVITPDGLLRLTNTTEQEKGYAFYSSPLRFKNSPRGKAFSFSTTFVFSIVHELPEVSGHGIAFVISPTNEFPGALPSQYLGLFNETNNGDPSNRVVAVELDTIINSEFGDIDDNHLGIDINGLRSNRSAPAAYFSSTGDLYNLSLRSGEPMQVWVEYRSTERSLKVTLAPIGLRKPRLPLLSLPIDLSPIFTEHMYVGFSSSTGSLLTSHYILGWSFEMNGAQAPLLDLSRLPPFPRRDRGSAEKSKVLIIGLPVLLGVVVFTLTISSVVFVIMRKMKFAEVLEDWETQYGPHRFHYKDLYAATKGFRSKQILGHGGFGRVYRGTLPSSKIEVAVKRISHDSHQGMREFVAEIATIGRIRHPNLVRLLGYCRRKGELLLVYDYMPNGSLDRFLYDYDDTIDWSKRFQVLKHVAAGLLYLHEDWIQLILHRDIKASNVLLDGDFNARLGDFGLARWYNHGTVPRTTGLVGTLGYIAPELLRTGKATTSTDVFAFGAFMLEVACGKRPIITDASSSQELVLVDWVSECQRRRGSILEAADRRLGSNYVTEEMELVLKLGLLCSHPLPEFRPSMAQVMEYLDRNVDLPDQYWSDGLSTMSLVSVSSSDLDNPNVSYASKETVISGSSTIMSVQNDRRLDNPEVSYSSKDTASLLSVADLSDSSSGTNYFLK